MAATTEAGRGGMLEALTRQCVNPRHTWASATPRPARVCFRAGARARPASAKHFRQLFFRPFPWPPLRRPLSRLQSPFLVSRASLLAKKWQLCVRVCHCGLLPKPNGASGSHLSTHSCHFGPLWFSPASANVSPYLVSLSSTAYSGCPSQPPPLPPPPPHFSLPPAAAIAPPCHPVSLSVPRVISWPWEFAWCRVAPPGI